MRALSIDIVVRIRRLLASLLLITLASCAATRGAARPEPTQARAEIDALGARIAQLRAEWHFGEPPPAELGARAQTPRCQTMTACADEICRAATRICALADALAEDDARRACQAARIDCSRARAHAERCR